MGPQARELLDRIVASGAGGVDRRDTDDWVLSRLIDLRYVEERAVNDSAFVCTSAGRYRWQIEMLADERREAMALRRRLIRDRVDERVSNLPLGTSTALTIIYPPMVPRLHGGLTRGTGPLPQPKTQLAFALATLFAATAAALLVIFGSTEPQDVQNWLSPRKLHAVATPPEIIVSAPIDSHAEEIADAAAVSTATVSIATVAPIDRHDGEQIALSDRSPAQVIDASHDDTAVAADNADNEVMRDAAVTAVALIGSAASTSGQLAVDVMRGVASSFSPIAAALLSAAAAAPDAPAEPAHDDAPVPVAMLTDEPTPPATVQPLLAPGPEPDRVAVVRAAKGPPRIGESDLDPQHAAVERLNMLSLAAARSGQVWRPNSPHKVAALRPTDTP